MRFGPDNRMTDRMSRSGIAVETGRVANAKSCPNAKSYIPEVVKFTRIGGSGPVEADGEAQCRGVQSSKKELLQSN